MLALAVALTAAGSLLLLGSAPDWARAAVLVPSAAMLTLWGLSRTFIGYATLPSKRNLAWVSALAALAAFSAACAPASPPQTALWVVWNSLWFFSAFAFISKDARTGIDNAVRAAGWILMVLAFYQRLVLGSGAPASALPSPGMYAGTALLIIPIALERRDRLLAFGLILTLAWSGSVGAWLGLFGAFVLLSPWTFGVRLYAGLTGLSLCLIAMYGRLESVEVLERASHWSAAWQAICARPLLGFGPGSWPSDAPAAYPLVVASELGIPFALAWFLGLWHCIAADRSHKRFGALAVLIHSLWDPVFAAPANLWLLSYCAASSIPESSEGVEIPARWRFPAGAAVAWVGFAVGRSALAAWGGR